MTLLPRLLVCLLLLAAPFATVVAQEKAGADKIVVQVDEDDAKAMNLALNNVQNIIDHYKEKGDAAEIEVVTFGPGLHMLRQDTSPVKERISTIATANPQVHFNACNNTLLNMTRQEGHAPALVKEARMVPSGVVRIIELQKQGYIYIKP